ncbi:Glutathione-specific gamma-glutamylcyclotransferase [Trinorchestia longiramus]|nr:Glutathione-specific gamma-glutamylcyclotransferase [Trinorchestia longiramus]
MWIFGYGSLTWKADFEFEKRVVGHIKGYKRRFWQASVDHRGIPEKPGRVAALIPGGPTDIVWGAAYEVADSILEKGGALDVREKTYQERRTETVYTVDGDTLCAVVFYGTNQDNLRLGPEPPERMARQIVEARGPSGPNYKYLLNLAEFMRNEVPFHKDEHLLLLEELVKKIMQEKGEALT